MSKTFDEGGAKGLLLANLGVSSTGCNIVFDSTLDVSTTAEEFKVATDEEDKGEPESVDVSSLIAHLESSVQNGQAVQQLPLVPQLAPLRSEFIQLKEEGFVEKVKPVRVKDGWAKRNRELLLALFIYLFFNPLLILPLLLSSVSSICGTQRRRSRSRSIYSC